MTIIVKCVRNGMNYHNLLSYELFWLIICEITNIYDATFRRLILVLYESHSFPHFDEYCCRYLSNSSFPQYDAAEIRSNKDNSNTFIALFYTPHFSGNDPIIYWAIGGLSGNRSDESLQ